jgi:histidinol-phosphate aminotransferase
MMRPLEYVSGIKPYVPGKPISELERELGITGSVKLASNENPLGASPKAVKALKNFLKNGEELGRYPDGGGYYLKNALAARLSTKKIMVSPEEIILGNGSNELLDIAVRTYMGPGDEAVMASPSFVVYAMAARSAGGTAIEVPLTGYRHDLMKMAGAVCEKTRMVFIANPNNPTGTMNTKDEFRAFMKRIPDGVLVVMDEAYYEYVTDRNYPDTLKYFADGKDILILRTFSKIYGLAGLRIGYGITRKEIVADMNRIREPFNTNTPAQTAALQALADKRHVKRSVEMNGSGKRYLYAELASMGIKYVPTEANFIYIPMDTDSKTIYEALLHEGVIIRPVGPKEIRVTIGLPEENRRFIDALRGIVQTA